MIDSVASQERLRYEHEEQAGLVESENDVRTIQPASTCCFGLIELSEGYTKLNLTTFFYASFASICSLVFMNAALPYILTNYLKIPPDSQGGATGDVLLWNEVVVILTISLWGTLSDKVGRKIIYILGFCLMGLSIFLTPFANSLLTLILIRVIFALGASASSVMLTALLADYPRDQGLGRSGGVIGVMAGLGAIFALFVFLRIPKLFNFYNDPKTNGDVMYWIVGGWLFISAVVLLVGLSDKKVSATKHNTIISIVRDGLHAATNPRIVLAYIASFAARGDSIALTSFLSLWVYQTEFHDNGMSDADALARAGVISGIAQTLAILGAPLFGLLNDKVDRVWCQTIAGFIAAVAYFFLFFLKSPDSPMIYIAVVLVGIGEIGMIICSQILLAAEAPPSVRGAVSGCFGLAGSVSILIITKLGGFLFDSWTHTAPFFLVAVVNAVVFVFGLILCIRGKLSFRRQVQVSTTDY